MAVHPLSASTHAPSGAHSGNFLAFVGGWFKFKLGYLTVYNLCLWSARKHFLTVI
jgi:hypothetical protein